MYLAVCWLYRQGVNEGGSGKASVGAAGIYTVQQLRSNPRHGATCSVSILVDLAAPHEATEVKRGTQVILPESDRVQTFWISRGFVR